MGQVLLRNETDVMSPGWRHYLRGVDFACGDGQ